MSRKPPTREQAEAAAWLARLGHHRISTETLRAFRDWRDVPANDAAYQEAEAFWEASGEQAADPEILRMTEAAFARRQGRRRAAWGRWPQLGWSLAAAGLLSAALVLAATAWLFPVYATGPGEQRVVRLEDGSRLHLNVDSKVRLGFSGNQRRLTLARGEAFFEVAHDAARPFIVAADGAEIRALGTKFDVRAQRRLLQVTLVEGQVEVQRDGQPQTWTLRPDQSLTVPVGGEVRRTEADAARQVSWTTGRLSFHNTPLAEAAAEVNRYGGPKIVLAGETLPRRQVSGYFDLGDTQSFVRGVSLLFDLQARATDGVITLRERATPGA
jgi:transmembrane sensor